MFRSSLVPVAGSPVKWLAELSQFASRHSDTGRLLACARDALVQTYGASRVQLGPQSAFTPVFPDGAGDTVPAGEIRVLVNGAEPLRIDPLPDRSLPTTGHGLLFGLDNGHAVGWYAETERMLDADDVEFLRGLAALIYTAFERRAAARERRVQVRRVLRAKQQWEAAVDAVPQGIVLLDGSARVLRVNRVLEDWGLGPMKSVQGRQLDELLYPLSIMSAPSVGEAVSALHAGDQREYEAEFPFASKRLRLTLRRLPGRSVEPGSPFAVLVLDDITRQHEAEEVLAEYSQRLEATVCARTQELAELNESLLRHSEAQKRDRQELAAAEQRYNTLVENTLAGIALVRNGTVEFCNTTFAQSFRRSHGQLRGLRVEDLIDGADCLAGTDVVGKTCTLRLKNDGEIPAAVRSHMLPIDTPEGAAVLWNIIDVSNETRVEEELRRSRAELQRLSELLITTQERERKRVALELHDGIGQSLSAIKIRIQASRLNTSSKAGCCDCATLSETGERIQDAMEEVRRIALDLRPPMLDDLGLLPTLEWFCREFQLAHSRPSLARDIAAREEAIPKRLRIVVYRIVQEAVRNVVDHAEASEVSLTLTADDTGVSLAISDNGIGFDPEGRPDPERRGLGLGSMRERAEMSGGEFDLRSGPHRGTTVQVRWPTR